MFGACIIRERIETDVEDIIMQIQDWNHDHDSDHGHMQMVFGGYVGRENFQRNQQLDSTFNSIFQIQSGFINGRGRFH